MLDVHKRQQHVLNHCKVKPSLLALAGGLERDLRGTLVYAPRIGEVEAVFGEVCRALARIPDDHELSVATINSGRKRDGRTDRVIE